VSSLLWDAIATPAGDGEEPAWSLFHEAAKSSPYEPLAPIARLAAWAASLPESLPFEACPWVDLPPAEPLRLPLGAAIAARRTPQALEPVSLSLEALAALLHHSYGVVGEPGERAVASRAGLHPLELFFHSRLVDGLPAGLYHYDPPRHGLHLLRGNDQSGRIASALADKSLVLGASVLIFLAAVPEREVLVDGDRGYRFLLLEAGAVAHSLDLAARALGLACLQVGDYYDRPLDTWLGADGLTMSVLHIVALGNERAGS